MPRFFVLVLATLLVVAAAAAFAGPVHGAGETPQWFTQLVDHFDPQNTNTWKQRYTVNDSFYSGKPGAPVFFFLSGEAPMEFFEFQEVQVINWAKKFGALYVVLEHRYYGESFPVPDLSTPNMRYLTSQQALADAANFLVSFNATLDQPGPWVVFGCSYSGALSAWFRAKYPHLVIGSVAPSGPVFAITDFTEYYAQFSRSAAPDCVAVVEKAVSQVQQMMQTPQGRQELTTIFNACEPITEENDYYFLYTLTEAIGGQDQMNNPPDWILNQTCAIMMQDGDLVANWAQVLNTQWPDSVSATGKNCTSFSEKQMIKESQGTSLSNFENRSWLWQTCVEFGFYQSSENGSSIFFPNLDAARQVEWCGEIFGIPGMTPNVDYTNTYYGGFNLHATNVMFTNGLLDPWHNLSINYDLPSGGVRAVTYEAGHCGTLIAATPNDPPSLVAARQAVEAFLEEILQEHYTNINNNN